MPASLTLELPQTQPVLVPARRRKLRRRRRLLIILLVLAGIGTWVGIKAFSKPEEIITVQTEKAARRDLTETVIASGRIQPVTQVMISPEVAGEIVDLPIKEGDKVKKGDLLVQIKPDNYLAAKNSAEANLKFAQGSRSQAEAELEKAESDFKQNEALIKDKLITQSAFTDFKTAYAVAKLRLQNSIHNADQAKFALARANDDLAKTTITAPIDGTVTKLKSQLGERVLGTSFNMGTEMMTIAQLDDMEARVDIGEIDIVLIEVGQNVQLEVDAFKDRKFKGTVSAIANAVRGPALSMGGSSGGGGSSSSQEAPKFEVRIRVQDKENFRPGMSVTAEIETRSRKDVLTVPIQSVTTRLPAAKTPPKEETGGPTPPKPKKKPEPIKPTEVVFVRDGDKAKMITVKTGISDNDYFEIVSGISEGQEVISGGYKAISKDLEDGKKINVTAEAPKPAGGK
jgi:HlyD family secretion protein